MNAVGSAIPSCHSDIRVFTSRAILRTGIWGERLELQRAGSARLRRVSSVAPMQIWDQFLNVRAGRTVNPSPPEVGLRMARLWDAIRESTEHGGAVISLPRTVPEAPEAPAEPAGPAGPNLAEAVRPVTRVTVWNEYRQERSDPAVGTIYPDGIHGAIGDGLRAAGFDVRDGDARRTGAWTHRRGPRRNRRVDLVGPRRA